MAQGGWDKVCAHVVQLKFHSDSAHYTPGRGKIVPRKLHSWYRENYVQKIKTSWAQWRTWRDSDYTIIILIFDSPKHTIFMLKLTFVVEL